MKNKYSNKTVLWFVCILLPLLGQATLAAEAKTHAYTLAGEIFVGPASSEELDIKVPFDSLITGVSFSANPKNIANNIVRVEIPFIANGTYGSENSAGTFYTPVPKMFVGEGVN